MPNDCPHQSPGVRLTFLLEEWEMKMISQCLGSSKALMTFAFLLIFCTVSAPAQVSVDLEDFRTATKAWRITYAAPIDLAVSPGSEAERARVWQMTGPFGGDVTALAIDPRNGDR